MEPRRYEFDLGAELRALRPTPRQEFAATLDARVAAGFPREPRRAGAPVAALRDRLRAASPRRLLVPAGAFALAAIVVATAVVAISTGVTNSGSPSRIADAGSAAKTDGLLTKTSEFSAPVRPQTRADKPLLHTGESATSGAASSDSSEVQFESAPPVATAKQAPGDSGPFASQARNRDVERSSQIVLGADSSQLRADAAKVFETVHAYDGIVLRSSIGDGAEGEAGATFDLLIPSGKLGDALAAFSRIAEVRSRHEASQDITAPTVHSAERLQDSRAKIEGLLLQLSKADNDAERVAVEAELRTERRHAATLRSGLNDLHRRANLSRVSLRIETGSASPSASGTGSWGIGDALSDAGRILAIAAGVTLIGLAILAPLALICAIAWLARRAWTRQRRERVLS